MARRRIGQEDLIARPEPRAASSLSELAALLDWSEIDRHLVGISGAAKGELGWPPLALFPGRLLATWHDLSDVRLAEDDRASFRRFCDFAAPEMPTKWRSISLQSSKAASSDSDDAARGSGRAMRSSWPIRRRAMASRAMRARESERAASPQAPFAHRSHYAFSRSA